MTVDRLVILLDRIPLVDRDDNSFSALVCDSGNLGILLRDALRRIDHDDADIRPLHRCHRTDDAVALDLFLNLILPSKTCGINKDIFFSVVGNVGINRIARGSRNVGDNHTVLLCQLVNEGGLADIRLTDDRNLRALVLLLVLRIVREVLDHFIQHISKSQHGCRRDRKRIADAEIVELIHIRHELLKAVHFVDHKHDRLAGASEHICHLGIRILQSLSDIREENNHVRRRNGNLRLLSHLRENDISAVRLNTAGIDHRKMIIQPVDVRIDTVSCHSRRILYN